MLIKSRCTIRNVSFVKKKDWAEAQYTVEINHCEQIAGMLPEAFGKAAVRIAEAMLGERVLCVNSASADGGRVTLKLADRLARPQLQSNFNWTVEEAETHEAAHAARVDAWKARCLANGGIAADFLTDEYWEDDVSFTLADPEQELPFAKEGKE